MMTRGNFISYLARIVEPSLRPTEPEQPVFQSCVKEEAKKRYVVDVAVTNLWNKPNQARAVDYPSTKIR